MNPKAYLTVGLQFGDEGKGTIVDSLVRKHEAKYVIRYSGGHQCAHNVVLPDGTHHTFRQFGSGTFAGAKTILTEDVIIDPVGLCIEAEELKSKGVANPFANLFIHENCLVTTPYHVALNRIKETARGKRAHGSCGVGIGETVEFALEYPQKAIHFKDLFNLDVLKEKLIFLDLEIKKKIYKLVAVEELVKEPYFEHFSLACVSWSIVVKEFNHILQDGPYICSSYYIQDIIANNITVWEAAQGTLLDEHYGFHPYTTWSTVTVHNALKYLKEVPYEKIGIMRAYTTRHGAGPFPTEDASLTDKYPELHNGTGKFQGNFRVGYLDIPLLRYAIDCNDGVDYIAITHFDYIENRKKIPLLSMRLDLKLHKLPPDNFLEREKQTQLLLQKPNKHSKKFNLCWTIAGDAEIFLGSVAFDLGIPIGIISRGPTHLDKTYL